MTIKPVDMYKAMVGWSEYRTGDEKHEPTHKLLSNEDWEQIMNYLETLKSKIKTRDQHLKDKDVEIENIHKEHKEEMANIEKKASENIARIQGEVERQKELNQNLLRICRERSNASRGLQPKKRHNGYMFVSKISQIKVVKERTKKDGNVYGTAWTATLESPYDVTIPLGQIKDRINSDLFDINGLFDQMNILFFVIEDEEGEKRIWTGEYIDVTEKMKEENKRNILYDIKFIGNPKSKLWEVKFFTTSEIEPLPELFVNSNKGN